MFDIELGDGDLEALNAIGAALGPAKRINILTDGARAAGAAAEAEVSEYPAKKNFTLPKYYTRTDAFGRTVRPYKSKFKSAAQQYFVVVVLGKKGKIPYRRTGTLGKSITSRITSITPTGATVAVGTNVPYGPRVIGTPAQGQYFHHRGTWTPLETNIQNALPRIEKAFTSAVRRSIVRTLSNNR